MPGRRRPEWGEAEDIGAGLDGDAAPQHEAEPDGDGASDGVDEEPAGAA